MATNSVPLMLLLTAVGFLIGAAAGYFAFKVEGRKAAPKPDEQADDPRKKFLIELVGLWRDRSTTRLVVWFEGKPLNSAQSLDATRRQQLETAGEEFLAWLGVKAPASQSPETPADTASPLPQPAAPVSQAPAMAPVVEAAAAADAGTAPAPTRPLTIVEQIDDILQEMVKKDASLAARAIRLLEDPREGAVVWVGLEHFNGVDTVPYPEVKAVLRQAAAEWEHRTERTRR